MKRFVSIITVLCLILSCGALFSSCKKDEELKQPEVEQITTTTTLKKDAEEIEKVFDEVESDSQDEVESEIKTNETETQTAYLDVTDKEGNSQTSKVEYSVMGGSDPYVEDIF